MLNKQQKERVRRLQAGVPKNQKCACGMSMASYPWTRMCKLCYEGRRKTPLLFKKN